MHMQGAVTTRAHARPVPQRQYRAPRREQRPSGVQQQRRRAVPSRSLWLRRWQTAQRMGPTRGQAGPPEVGRFACLPTVPSRHWASCGCTTLCVLALLRACAQGMAKPLAASIACTGRRGSQRGGGRRGRSRRALKRLYQDEDGEVSAPEAEAAGRADAGRRLGEPAEQEVLLSSIWG